MTEYKFTMYCPYCGIEYYINFIENLHFSVSDLFCNKCRNIEQQTIKNIKTIIHCNCERCTGIPSVESYYEEEE